MSHAVLKKLLNYLHYWAEAKVTDSFPQKWRCLFGWLTLLHVKSWNSKREWWTGSYRWNRERMAGHVLIGGGPEEALPWCPANMLELEQSCTLDPATLPIRKVCSRKRQGLAHLLGHSFFNGALVSKRPNRESVQSNIS